jgi:hypothetical protein
VWLWPDKDGVQEWQQVADKLGSDKVQVYTRFFETCWRECDGDKADCADIIIRMMTNGDQPRKETHTGDPQPPTELRTAACAATTSETPTKPDDISDEDWNEHQRIMAAIENFKKEHPENEPFRDAVEMVRPDIRELRDRIRKSDWERRHPNQPIPETLHSTIEGVMSVGDILRKHPTINKLI